MLVSVFDIITFKVVSGTNPFCSAFVVDPNAYLPVRFSGKAGPHSLVGDAAVFIICVIRNHLLLKFKYMYIHTNNNTKWGIKANLLSIYSNWSHAFVGGVFCDESNNVN